MGLDSGFESYIYYTDSIDSEYKVSDLDIYLNCCELDIDELYLCTAMESAFSHLIVIDCIVAE